MLPSAGRRLKPPDRGCAAGPDGIPGPTAASRPFPVILPGMAWPTSLQVALKEWATVCHALETGRQTVLLRKGGIYEAAGEFEVENREFLLFPTYLHQNLKMLKPDAHAGFEARSAEPAQVKLSAAGVVTDIVQL